MADHLIDTHQTDDKRWVAVCTCQRWRSKPYTKRGDAWDAGDAHAIRGDTHNRALAQFQRGSARLETELKWYEEEAENMLNSESDRQMWARLADELRHRVNPEPDHQQTTLF